MLPVGKRGISRGMLCGNMYNPVVKCFLSVSPSVLVCKLARDFAVFGKYFCSKRLTFHGGVFNSPKLRKRREGRRGVLE